MNKFFLILINIVLLAVIFLTVFYLFIQKTKIFSDSYHYTLNKTLNVSLEGKIKEIKREKPAEKEIRGIYLTSYTASRSDTMERMIDFIHNTELNAVVIDIKDYSGTIAYDSQIPLVNELQNDRHLIKDLPTIIQKLQDKGIYVIARQTVFQDPELTSKRPDMAVRNTATGGVWYDWKGLAWADPTDQAVWDYNLQIAQEVISLGFDEINFDYIRFPSDGPMRVIGFKNLAGRTKAQVMKDFLLFYMRI